MSVRLYPIKNQLMFQENKCNKYLYMELIKLNYFINKSKLENIIRNVLLNFCEVSVIGYERLTDKYWCKICENNCCILHVEIEILYKNNNTSDIHILPFVGNKTNLKKFIFDINEALQLYQTSTFIKNCLEL
jgi:hypothetical protein